RGAGASARGQGALPDRAGRRFQLSARLSPAVDPRKGWLMRLPAPTGRCRGCPCAGLICGTSALGLSAPFGPLPAALQPQVDALVVEVIGVLGGWVVWRLVEFGHGLDDLQGAVLAFDAGQFDVH